MSNFSCPVVQIKGHGKHKNADSLRITQVLGSTCQNPLKSTIAGCIREGVVVKPVVERWNYETHRTILKLVSEAYLLRKGGSELH
jgi:hypothetical protein